ncbi:hypothetical protein [Pseudomonas graminis]|uniref:Morphogenetic protein n=1 Tax=Pseudomonas graminis TaxID=158627 RepID=A0A1I0HZE6_9PSED|nr:hypothetical protein [Pseudomonas graminis]SET89517.1 hypothetical protein SAMN05216197_13118 [Pseudomonas graminis]
MTAIKERPILFSAPMVRALLEGRKTVTRREVKKQAALDCLAAGFEPAFLALPGNADMCPYGQPGDRLWVRETWAQPANLDPGPTVYRATYPDCLKGQGWENLPPSSAIRWKPSIHMFRRHSRILLEITDVRVERLQAITYEDAVAEGVHRDDACRMWTATDEGGACHKYPVPAFRDLWSGINGPDAWAANPWVWVVEFKRVAP